MLSEFGFSTISMNAIVAVPLVTLVTALISFGISWILNQIPFVKKYFV